MEASEGFTVTVSSGGDGELTVEQLEAQLVVTFGAFMSAFMSAQDAGIDAAPLLSAHLQEAVGPEAWASMPLAVKMLLG
jgi:hypothetical protein